MKERFRMGEALIVTPRTDEDPEAERLRGALCNFVRYSPQGHAVVQLTDRARPVHFRASDLQRAQEAEMGA